MSTIAVGWKAQLGWLAESSYGISPTNAQYNWIGSFQPNQAVTVTLDQKAFYTWRMDGATRYPNNILQGPREVDCDIQYNPQDIGILSDMINNVASVSHSIIINDTDINTAFTIYGARANTIRMEGRTNAPFLVDASYWAQNINFSLPTGATFSSDPGVTPFYFPEQEVIVAGSVTVRPLSFTVTITNNLSRVYQFNQAYIRALPTLNATVEGTITFTLQDISEMTSLLNMTAFDLKLLIGTNGPTNYYLEIPVTKYTASRNLDFSPGDMVTFDMDFKGETPSIHT